MARFVEGQGINFDDVLIVPQKSIVNSRKEINLRTTISKNQYSSIEIERPIISANMDTITEKVMACAMSSYGAAGFIHRYKSYEEIIKIIKFMKKHNYHPIIPSIGCTNDEYWDNISFMYLSEGADGICIDVAHGHSDMMINQLKRLTTKFPKEHFIAGNIATKDAAIDLINAGATGLKVGIGPGSVCTTRKETGAGIPQLSAIMDVSYAASQRNIPVIADGGIKHAGDITKALAAGASAVMIGSLFAGTNEVPIPGVYRGMASVDAKKEFNLKTDHVEGISKTVKSNGSVRDIIFRLSDGVRSGISYAGARNIKELQERCEFIVLR